MRLGSRTLGFIFAKVAYCWFESNLYRMGYYTRYDFSIVEADGLGYVEHKRKLELIESFRKESHGAAYAFDEFGNSNDEVKWYDCQKDILEFSIKHPSIIFLISGVGEERSDDWKLYVQDGHSQISRAETIYPPLDRAKLQSDILESKLNKVLK